MHGVEVLSDATQAPDTSTRSVCESSFEAHVFPFQSLIRSSAEIVNVEGCIMGDRTWSQADRGLLWCLIPLDVYINT